MADTKNSLYTFVHSPVSVTADDVDPMKRKRKSFNLDVGALGIKCRPLGENSLETVYKQLSSGYYIIQPRYMLDSGSMCVTELYPNSLRVRLIHELLFKDKMELRDDKFPKIKKVPTKKINPILQKKLQELLKKPATQAKMEMMVRTRQEKKLSKNKSLIIYEKKRLCRHSNTDGAGTLLRNMSLVKRQLRASPYLRRKKQLTLLKDKKAHFNSPERNSRVGRLFPSTTKHSNASSKNKLMRLAREYEDSIGIAQNSLEYD